MLVRLGHTAGGAQPPLLCSNRSQNPSSLRFFVYCTPKRNGTAETLHFWLDFTETRARPACEGNQKCEQISARTTTRTMGRQLSGFSFFC